MKSGWLLIDKEAGITSASLLNKIKKIFYPSKIGHAGTLDPFATGLLVAGIGNATRLMEYAMARSKIYQFEVQWGFETDSMDITGKTIKEYDDKLAPSKLEIDSILDEFKGKIMQTPPKFSAILLSGERAYDKARRDEDFEIPKREIEVYSLECLSSGGNTSSFIMHCSKGCYVRSIAKDIAYRLQKFCTVKTIDRLQSGKFLKCNAVKSDNLLDLYKENMLPSIQDFILPIDAVLDDILVYQASNNQANKICSGIAIEADSNFSEGDVVAVYSENEFIAICKYSNGVLKPYKVFIDSKDLIK